MTQLEFALPPRPNPSVATAIAERDEGIANATAGAEATAPGWTDLAFQWLRTYARDHASFISEQATDAARAWGLVQPENPKAWGGVFRKAAREGVIRRDGFGTSNRRHRSPTPLWRSLVLREREVA